MLHRTTRGSALKDIRIAENVNANNANWILIKFASFAVKFSFLLLGNRQPA